METTDGDDLVGDLRGPASGGAATEDLVGDLMGASPERLGTRLPPVVLIVLALAPLLWFTHLAVSYALVPLSCRVGSDLPLHVVTVLGLAALVTASVMAVRAARRGDRRAVALVCAALAAYFTFVVAWTGLVAVVVDRCA